MPARVVVLADALVAMLNAPAPFVFSQSFNAERRWLPYFDLPDLKTIRVSVVPREDKGKKLTRNSWQHDTPIDIAIQQKLPDYDVAAMDAGVLLAEEINTFFETYRPATPEKLVQTTVQALVVNELLKKNNIFSSVVTLDFMAER